MSAASWNDTVLEEGWGAGLATDASAKPTTIGDIYPKKLIHAIVIAGSSLT
jgi:hypothetical protein